MHFATRIYCKDSNPSRESLQIKQRAMEPAQQSTDDGASPAWDITSVTGKEVEDYLKTTEPTTTECLQDCIRAIAARFLGHKEHTFYNNLLQHVLQGAFDPDFSKLLKKQMSTGPYSEYNTMGHTREAHTFPPKSSRIRITSQESRFTHLEGKVSYRAVTVSERDTIGNGTDDMPNPGSAKNLMVAIREKKASGTVFRVDDSIERSAVDRGFMAVFKTNSSTDSCNLAGAWIIMGKNGAALLEVRSFIDEDDMPKSIESYLTTTGLRFKWRNFTEMKESRLYGDLLKKNTWTCVYAHAKANDALLAIPLDPYHDRTTHFLYAGIHEDKVGRSYNLDQLTNVFAFVESNDGYIREE
jgi:hypothetical protein